ncbi:MAG: class III signal peptide-containing protein [Candidatus Omnitrophica bacterium]|nr:class III signal peptide-containing protein [Candidatus Omnitrophota bacterium]
MGRDRRGQSTLEYILVLAAILVAVILAANSLIRPAVTQQMTQSGAIINGAANNLKTNLGL